MYDRQAQQAPGRMIVIGDVAQAETVQGPNIFLYPKGQWLSGLKLRV